MLKNDTLKNGKSRIGLYGSAPPRVINPLYLSFVLILRYCENLKAIRYESTSLNRIVADKSHRVIVA